MSVLTFGRKGVGGKQRASVDMRRIRSRGVLAETIDNMLENKENK